jgi:hypothetical protein
VKGRSQLWRQVERNNGEACTYFSGLTHSSTPCPVSPHRSHGPVRRAYAPVCTRSGTSLEIICLDVHIKGCDS